MTDEKQEVYVQMVQKDLESTLEKIISKRNYQRTDFERDKTARAVALSGALHVAIEKAHAYASPLMEQLKDVMASKWDDSIW